jgi:hypothetical protein
VKQAERRSLNEILPKKKSVPLKNSLQNSLQDSTKDSTKNSLAEYDVEEI